MMDPNVLLAPLTHGRATPEQTVDILRGILERLNALEHDALLGTAIQCDSTRRLNALEQRLNALESAP
jgi:hypothetical protein